MHNPRRTSLRDFSHPVFDTLKSKLITAADNEENSCPTGFVSGSFMRGDPSSMTMSATTTETAQTPQPSFFVKQKFASSTCCCHTVIDGCKSWIPPERLALLRQDEFGRIRRITKFASLKFLRYAVEKLEKHEGQHYSYQLSSWQSSLVVENIFKNSGTANTPNPNLLVLFFT